MQDLSFNFKNAIFQWGQAEFSVMIYTHSNAFSLNPTDTTAEDGRISCSSLLTCGGQETAEGKVVIREVQSKNEISLRIKAKIDDLGEEIRSVKVTIRGLPTGEIINLIDARPKEIPVEGLRFKYPEGWRDAGTPLVLMKTAQGKSLYVRSMDTRVREKTFVFQKEETGLRAELIYEPVATEMGNTIEVPEWKIGFTSKPEQIYEDHRNHAEAAFELQRWKEREDVPSWARDVSLIAAIHCQHWTGYIFNDYQAVLEDIEKLCDKIESRRILAFLPGWEGRYYWKYGNYSPDERLGGAEGFRKLIEGAHRLGVHVMPMFGINITGVHHEGFSAWGEPCEIRTASGNFSRASVDWDGSRHYDHSSNRTLNPASPKWQNRLVQQITGLADDYGFDGAFLDIAAAWSNDPNHYVYEGVKALTSRLKENRPDFLLAGEGWYDGLMACIPLLQCGHTDGHLHWHDEAYAPMFDTYARNFGHLCLGDPVRLSTGVHEQGTNPEWRCPLRKGIIPTMTIVDGTLDDMNHECVNQIIADAKEYAERYLG